MYRILREHRQIRERRRLARHPARRRPELVADAPRQVFSWDITELSGPVKGSYFDAYVMIDVYSRYIVGVRVHARESEPLAASMMREVFDVQGVPHVVHADRGTSTTSKLVADLLEDLTVTRSHSRPKVSNDNPYSEAWFKTLKYAPVFPDQFASLADARQFMTDFVTWYNNCHRHSGIGLHPPRSTTATTTRSVPAAKTPSPQPAQHIRNASARIGSCPRSSIYPTSLDQQTRATTSSRITPAGLKSLTRSGRAVTS